jgi:signal transduction histidine kinase/CheY-like chemotaxis protein
MRLPLYVLADEWAARFPAASSIYPRVDELSFALLPLIAQGRVIGLLGLCFEVERELDEADRDFLQVLARQCAQALERGQLFSAALAERVRLESALQQLRTSEQQDITERTSLRERLAAADRMASLGSLAAGVAHEINNPLAYVSANLRYLDRSLEHLPEDAVAPALRGSLARFGQAVADARDGVSRVAEIVRDLRAISRSTEDKRGQVDILIAVDIAVKMSSVQVSHKARVLKEYGDVPRVFANEARLVQVFINLLVNAAQAIAEGAPCRNEIRIVTRTDERGRAVVEIRDTGSGIPPEIHARIFEPFFTTKPPDIGTGMGLSICHGIVAAHDGEISMESEVGKGSIFRVALPAYDRASGVGEHVEGDRRSSSPPNRRSRLLIVDDEIKLGTAIQKELSGMHDVEFLASGTEALARVKGGDRFDLILCDLVMPLMSGMVLYQEIQTLAPEQARRMIFLTGGAFTATARSFLHEVGNPYLEKPFDLDRLHAVVHDALE